MSLINDREHGPDYHQPEKPTDVSQGKLWFNPETDKSSMADGVDYWGQVVLGTAGYCVGGNVSGFLTKIEKMSFSTESWATSIQSVSNIAGQDSTASSLQAGYIGGVVVSPLATYTTTV